MKSYFEFRAHLNGIIEKYEKYPQELILKIIRRLFSTFENFSILLKANP